MNKVEEYIEKNWDKCLKSNTQDEGTLIGLPYPYTVPAVGAFDEMYYWDTYFTNVGLLKSGHFEYAKNNVLNMQYMIEKFGFMLNGNRTYYLNRSQPPFFSEMVMDVYRETGDKEWLRNLYPTVKKEYEFWMSRRMTEVGLNAYKGELKESEYEKHVGDIQRRLGLELNDTLENIAAHTLLTWECGWDCNPRWGFRGQDFAHIDLNSLLYLHEMNMHTMATQIGCDCEAEKWLTKANERKALMIKFMQSEDGLLMDYNFKEDRLSDVFSVASIYPMFAGMADKEHAEAVVRNLDRLEYDHGVVACEENDLAGIYQWGYPNGWACHQYMVVKGLERYGYKDEAKRIARKYIDLVDRNFDVTGNLWEKYNVVTGTINVAAEYKMPPMMGWTAGVYIGIKQLTTHALS